jgi:hypothetical protein
MKNTDVPHTAIAAPIISSGFIFFLNKRSSGTIIKMGVNPISVLTIPALTR